MTNHHPKSNWFAYPERRPEANVRLFCFPYAGGGSQSFRVWHRSLPPNVETSVALLPGRENRLAEEPFRQLPGLVDALAQHIRPHLDKPFVFFGHSMGAIIAFELAQTLRRNAGLWPLRLFVSGRPAPHLPETKPPTYNLPEPEFVEELQRLNGTPKEVLADEEFMQLITPTLRADFEVCQTYAYREEPPLDCPIVALGGLQDAEAGSAELEPWRAHTTTSFSLHMFEGDHFYLNTGAAALLRLLGNELALFAM
jgi:medium-chain acyl-[acyl-carrier-protein] hydrolase